MILQRALVALVAGMLLLPMLAIMLAGFGRLLGAMGDATGAAVLGRIALAAAILWSCDLVFLLAVLGMRAASSPADDTHSEQ
ncbi:MAG TPA: hypothetical protein VHZ24_05050 [Pirellulales bacterium]|nr:hypothetical protein [Pirellulales bacterium]